MKYSPFWNVAHFKAVLTRYGWIIAENIHWQLKFYSSVYHQDIATFKHFSYNYEVFSSAFGDTSMKYINRPRDTTCHLLCLISSGGGSIQTFYENKSSINTK